MENPVPYFPSMEKTYGRPISEWKALIRGSDVTKHMELVNWLKQEHGVGHGRSPGRVLVPLPLIGRGDAH